jgi:hypothetical protein
MIKLYNPISITKHFVSFKIPPQTFYFQKFFLKRPEKRFQNFFFNDTIKINFNYIISLQFHARSIQLYNVVHKRKAVTMTRPYNTMLIQKQFCLIFQCKTFHSIMYKSDQIIRYTQCLDNFVH